MTFRAGAVATSVVLNLMLPVVAANMAEAQYTFTKIADSASDFGSSDSPSIFDIPSVNDAGVVAFAAMFKAGGAGVFKGSGGSLTRIDNGIAGLVATGENTAINNSGTVAFVATLPAGGVGILPTDLGLTRLACVIGNRRSQCREDSGS